MKKKQFISIVKILKKTKKQKTQYRPSNVIYVYVYVQIQFTELASSKSYIEVDNVTQAFETLLQLFEAQLRIQHQEIIGTDKITYDYKDVMLFLDELKSIVLLIFDKNLLAFVPKDLEWIKQQLLQHLHIQSY